MTGRPALQSPATERQRAYALSLAGDRALTALGDTRDQRIAHVTWLFDAESIGRVDASVLIERLLAAPRDGTNVPATGRQHVSGQSGTSRPAETDRPAARIGVYRLDGRTYVVRKARGSDRTYALELVSSPPRVMESGDVRELELEYRRGMIYELRDEHRLPAEEVERVSRVYGRCLQCGARLKAARSVQRMIGPVCWKRVS